MRVRINFFALILLSFSSGSAVAQVMVKDIEPIAKKGSEPELLFAVEETLFFFSKGSSEQGKEGGMWKSDGTPEGTQFVNKFHMPEQLVGLNGSAYFLTQLLGQGSNYTENTGLWRYDITATEESNTKEKSNGFLKKAGNVARQSISVNGKPLSEKENTTTAHKGFTLLTGMVPMEAGQSQKSLRVMEGTLYFMRYDRNIQLSELWKSDGTAKGTIKTGVKLKTNEKLNLTVIGNTLYFTADNGTQGYELWKSDGTAAGTTMVKDLNAIYRANGDTESSHPNDFINVNGTLFFTADDGINGRQLWKSDGTAAGTVMVKNFGLEGHSITSYNGGFAAVNNLLYFSVNSTEFSKGNKAGYQIGKELWKTDGTEKGTVMVKEINPYTSSFPADLINVNGTLFFIADDGTHGRELWKSDGTAAGTVLVKDINTVNKGAGSVGGGGTDKKLSACMTAAGNTLYFVADDGIHGAELWKSDGTAAGTLMVKDIRPFGSFGAEPKHLTYINGTLFFTADDGTHGRELWKYEVAQ